MTRFLSPPWATALLALAAAAGPARADYFYLWTADTPLALSDHSGMGVTLTAGGDPSGPTGPVSGPQGLAAASLATFVNPGVTGTDTFSQGQRLAVGLTLVDGTDSEKVSFPIGVAGSLTAGGANSLTYTFLGGTSGDLTTAQALTVNGHPYTVALQMTDTGTGIVLASIVPVTSSGGGSSGDAGGGAGGPVNTAPEPSGLVLAAIGTGSVLMLLRKAVGTFRDSQLVT
jgi:hypothetical protein